MIKAGNRAGEAFGKYSMNDLMSSHATRLIIEFPYLSLKLRTTSFPISSPLPDSNINTCFVVSTFPTFWPVKLNDRNFQV